MLRTGLIIGLRLSMALIIGGILVIETQKTIDRSASSIGMDTFQYYSNRSVLYIQPHSNEPMEVSIEVRGSGVGLYFVSEQEMDRVWAGNNSTRPLSFDPGPSRLEVTNATLNYEIPAGQYYGIVWFESIEPCSFEIMMTETHTEYPSFWLGVGISAAGLVFLIVALLFVRGTKD